MPMDLAYGPQGRMNQRRMIDESPAGEEFKQALRGKLDAPLALAEATDCRRRAAGLLWRNLHALRQLRQLPEPACRVDGDAARKLLSTIYRAGQRHRLWCWGISWTSARQEADKVAQFGHDKLSTFGIGADLTWSPNCAAYCASWITTGAWVCKR